MHVISLTKLEAPDRDQKLVDDDGVCVCVCVCLSEKLALPYNSIRFQFFTFE